MSSARISNPANRFEALRVTWDEEEAPKAELEVREEVARSALSKNESADIPFRYSINPYRGCFHACAYCYARPSHEYLGLGAGSDFDRRIIVRREIDQRLRETFAKRSWKTSAIVFSGVTDCYQPLEAHYRLTRACLKACVAFQNPVVIITKSPHVLRDVDLLVELARCAQVRVVMSIAFANETYRKALEPSVGSTERRFDALEQLAAKGVPTGIAVAPVIPGLNDADIPGLLRRAHACGATSAFMTLLRLPGSVMDVFRARLAQALPMQEAKVLSSLRQTRGGKLHESAIGRRMEGQGPRWDLIDQLFRKQLKKLGMSEHYVDDVAMPSSRKACTSTGSPKRQLTLLG